MFAKTNVPFNLEAQAQALVYGWMKHFREQDLALPYTSCETAHFLDLGDGILLVGIIDAEGTDFFSEYKTANPRGAKTWKREWLLSTQALTYGLLTGGTTKFLVRKAFKSATPTYDHEWFEFNQLDLEMWRDQVRFIGDEISNYRHALAPVWPLNLEHGCFAYGPNYPCPFWQDGCTKNNFDGPIPGSVKNADFGEFTGENKVTLISTIDRIKPRVVLSATRIKNWMRCREMYRRLQTMSFPPSDAMLLGSRFHALIAAYTKLMIQSKAQEAL